MQHTTMNSRFQTYNYTLLNILAKAIFRKLFYIPLFPKNNRDSTVPSKSSFKTNSHSFIRKNITLHTRRPNL